MATFPFARDRTEVCVPMPPSANNLFRSMVGKTGGVFRVKTTEYKRWIKSAELELMRLRGPESMPARLRLTARGKINRARDLDNMIKPIQDALVEYEVIPGDNLMNVIGLVVDYKPDHGEPRVSVTLESAKIEIGVGS